jgi:hypothetical protein
MLRALEKGEKRAAWYSREFPRKKSLKKLWDAHGSEPPAEVGISKHTERFQKNSSPRKISIWQAV